MTTPINNIDDNSENNNQAKSYRIIRLPDVMERTGLKRSTIYKHIHEGSFPRNVSLGKRSVGWLESDINEWIESKINKDSEA